jgi:hypothetical protein
MDAILFEDKFGKNIKDFQSTSDIDDFIAKELGKSHLDIISLDQNIVVKGGCIFKLSDVDIDAVFDAALNK